MENHLYLCEKPSQAMDIAKILGIISREDGYIVTQRGNITWAVGHLLALTDPDGYNPDWKRWNKDDLPILPSAFTYQPVLKTKKQLNLVGRLLKNTHTVVVSTDAGREGEAIGRELLDYFSFEGDVKRLWLSALDPASIKKALGKIKPGAATEPLYHAAQARSQADWLFGINLTRGATLHLGNGSRQVISVGRVQTPTLQLVVTRDRLIEQFVPRQFYELDAVVSTSEGSLTLRHAPPVEPVDKRIYRKEAAQALAESCRGQTGILQVNKERKKQGPPKLFNLASLQKACNKSFGWPAIKTLDIAQSLYETHKITTYPRSDCHYLPEEQQPDAPVILAHLSELDEFANRVPQTPVYRKSVFNTTKVEQSDHHAIIPTRQAADLNRLSKDELNAYLLICRHYLAALSPDHVYDQTTVATTVSEALFKGTDKVTVAPGWKVLFAVQQQSSQTFPAGLQNKCEGLMRHMAVIERTTTPPDHYTEGTLIDDMIKIAKYVDDPALKSRLKATSGIGTEATRANILETLKSREFIRTDKKKIISTKTARALIDALPESVTSIGKTAIWEDVLESIASGEQDKDSFIQQIKAELQQLLRQLPAMQPLYLPKEDSKHPCPVCGNGMLRRKGSQGYFWGCSDYPNCKTTLPDDKGKPGKPKSPVEADERYPCPDCERPMVRRQGKKGYFWGCSGFPECKNTLPDDNGQPAKVTVKPVSTRAGESCPNCETGQLINRELKTGKNKGKAFIGCSGYPDCNYFAWKK